MCWSAKSWLLFTPLVSLPARGECNKHLQGERFSSVLGNKHPQTSAHSWEGALVPNTIRAATLRWMSMGKCLGGLLVSKDPWQHLLPRRARTMLVLPGEGEEQHQLRSISSSGCSFAPHRKDKADCSRVLLLCSPFAARRACSNTRYRCHHWLAAICPPDMH